jgi:uncharacterized cupredoxin-like copper-binding protein
MSLRKTLAVSGAAVSLALPCSANALVHLQQVRVTAGAPLEFGFVLSRTVVSTGTVVFKIKNLGLLRHRFEVCAAPGALGPNSCAGKETGWIAPRSSTSLRVRFSRPGRYEYLCAVRGHAAAGMKGLLTVL